MFQEKPCIKMSSYYLDIEKIVSQVEILII